ncbi:MAG: hypothetical protein WD069_13440 [Planctomycetales bacterium]
MALKSQDLGISEDLLEAIRSFPVEREVEHCGTRIKVSPFEFYVDCPHCGSRLKLRSFSAIPEIEDVFDAVFEWLGDPEARRSAEHRRQAIEADRDEED